MSRQPLFPSANVVNTRFDMLDDDAITIAEKLLETDDTTNKVDSFNSTGAVQSTSSEIQQIGMLLFKYRAGHKQCRFRERSSCAQKKGVIFKN